MSAVAAAAASGVEFLLDPVDVGSAASWVESHPDLPLPRMCIVAQKPPLSADDIERFLQFLQDALDAELRFTVLWDTRGAAFPSNQQFRRVIAWLEEDGRAEVWDDRVQGNALIIRSAVVRTGMRLMAAVARAPQPIHVGSDVESAFAFARDKCTIARSWSSEKKLK